MFFRIVKKHQKFSGAVLLALFVFAVLAGSFATARQAGAQEALGQTGGGTSGKKIGEKCGWLDIQCGARALVQQLLYGYFYVIGMILGFEFKILEFVLTSFSWRNDTVTLGWGIVRDFSNLFFIVVIMIIAFATVLQLESYGMKALLPQLIAIALLINFSLAICGFLINFADSFGKTFIHAGGDGPSLSLAVSAGLGASNLASNPENSQAKKDLEETIKNKGGKDDDTFLTIIATFALGLLAGLIMIFVIGAGVFFMLIRQISLMYIVVLSPVALVCLLVPFLNEYWSEWKKAFLKWVIFYPVYMFFFYIAIMIINSNAISPVGLDGTMKGFTGITSATAMWRLFMASMFLIGAIMVAQKTGVAGANAIAGFGMKQLKDFSGVTRMGKAFEAAGKRREERREMRSATGIGAQLRKAGIFGRGAKERAILGEKDAKKKMQETQDKLYGVKRGRKGDIMNVGDEAGLRKAANKKTIFGTVASARKNIMAKTLKDWEAKRTPSKEEKEEDLSAEAALASMGGGPKAK